MTEGLKLSRLGLGLRFGRLGYGLVVSRLRFRIEVRTARVSHGGSQLWFKQNTPVFSPRTRSIKSLWAVYTLPHPVGSLK